MRKIIKALIGLRRGWSTRRIAQYSELDEQSISQLRKNSLRRHEDWLIEQDYMKRYNLNEQQIRRRVKDGDIERFVDERGIVWYR